MDSLRARCVVSADTGAPDDTREVGAVDWLNGPILLSGPLENCDGSEGTSSIRFGDGAFALMLSSRTSFINTVGLEFSFGRWMTVGLCRIALANLLASCWDKPGVDLLVFRTA